MFREYDDKQLMMFGMSTNDLVDAFLNKILSIRIYYGYEQGGLPTGTYHGDPQYHHVPGKPHEGSHDYIEIEGIDARKYNRSVQYQRYTDSVIYHELVHAVNFHKKLWDEVTYTSLDVPSEKYYSDPEEVRAYRSQIRDFLVGHLGLSRGQAEKLMAKYSTDQSKHRVAWMPRYYDLKELEYPMAGKDDLQSYGGISGWKGKIVWMSPDKFLKLCHPLPERFRSPHSLARLRDRMKNKLPIDFLVLKVDSQKKKVIAHEGRHRATVAKELGIEKVPVLVYFEESYPRVPKWGPEHHDFADKAEFKPEYDKT